MPFKIVQTQERGKKFLSCVPDAWEDNNVLLWPRKGSKKLQKNEESHPADDWITCACTVKRTLLTYEEAQAELQCMQQSSDTEEAASSRNRRDVTSHVNINLEELARQCIFDKENTPPVQDVQVVQPTVTPERTSFIIEEPAEDQGAQTLYFINPTESEKSNFEESVLQRLQNLENGHNIILQKLSELGAQIERFLRQAQQQKVIAAIGFDQIDSIQALQDFEESLKNQEVANSFKEKLMVICGSGKGRGADNSFALSEVMFTRRFLNECSWAGGSRGVTKKSCFKAYGRVISFFFDLIHASDKSFTMIECEKFFKNILKNSNRRLTAKMQRTSVSKARGKGKGKKSQAVTQNTGAAVSTDSEVTPPNQNENQTEIPTRDST